MLLSNTTDIGQEAAFLFIHEIVHLAGWHPATCQAALQTTPELSEDDTVATFNLDVGFIKLSLMPSGVWGFHL